MLTTKAIMKRKENWFEPTDCAIAKIVELSAEDYEAFSQHMMRDYDFIADNKDSMFVDGKGIWHGLLVLGAHTNDAIFVESEGSNYARYSSFLPNFKPYINSQILQLADLVIKDGAKSTPNGRCVVGFGELEERYGVVVSHDNGIEQMLVGALNMSDEVAELEMTEDGFDVTYYLDYCSNLDEKHRPAPTPTTKLSDILRCNFEDVHLCHRDIDDATASCCGKGRLTRFARNSPAAATPFRSLHPPLAALTNVPISELSDTTLTAEGKQAWADILGADVHRVYSGMYGLQVELSGVKASRLYEFGNALAGYCSQENCEKWFTPEDTEPTQTMKME